MINTPQTRPDVPEGWTLNTPDEGVWLEVGTGIRALALAPEMAVMLVEFEPYASWPGMDIHDNGPEELTILGGSLHLGIPGQDDMLVTAGWRVRAERSTRHTPRAGQDGCRLIAVYPMQI